MPKKGPGFELIQRKKAMVFIGDHQGFADGDVSGADGVDAVYCALEQAARARQKQKLFGRVRARKRPKAGSGASAKDDGGDCNHG